MKEATKYGDLTVGDVVRFYDSVSGLLYGIAVYHENKLKIWREKMIYNIVVHPYRDRLMWPIKIIESVGDIPDYFKREFRDEVIDAAGRNGIKYHLKM